MEFSSSPDSMKDNGLWITGLGSQYPPEVLTADHMEDLAARFYDTKSEGLQQLLKINRATGIESRAAVKRYDTGFAAQKDPPLIADLDVFFRDAGVALATQACRKAMREAGLQAEDITHTVAVTCTNQGNPGYDLLVHRELGVKMNVQRMLLHGVGCAGGLSIMRAAAQVALAASGRRRPARVLAFACELCTPLVRCELAAAEKSCAANVGVAGALFSDAAAAFVLCNAIGLEDRRPLFRLGAFDSALLPDTLEQMTSYADPIGMRTVITRAVPRSTKQAVKPTFARLVGEYSQAFDGRIMEAADFDWALHPGGVAIIDGVKVAMQLSEEQVHASREIYRTRGNSSSPTVLIVLDRLREMGKGRDHIVATSFGPGLTIEMAFFERCRAD